MKMKKFCRGGVHRIPLDPQLKLITPKVDAANIMSTQSAGIAPEVNLRNPLCTGEEAHKQENPPWL